MTQFQTQAANVVPCGLLAAQHGEILPLEVLCNGSGHYYLGTCSERGAFTRESHEYWKTEVQANKDWESGRWTQRDHL